MMTIRGMSGGAGYSARHLEYSDYLDEGAKTQGQWFGEAAKALGLTGQVTNEQFERLRECEHPDTGEFLRQRRGADRYRPDGSTQSEEKSMFDLTFSAPKSVSIVGVMEDPRLLEAQAKAVAEALAEAEKIAGVEDQRDGQKLVRQTGNIAVATYQHDTSRQLDPQIHTHAVLFNFSYDKETDSYKALHSPSVYQRRAYLTECYRNALAREVMALGYEIENRWNDRGTDLSFEIKNVSPELIEKYSKRSAEKREAIARFIEDKGREPSNDEVTVLVRETRDDKLQEIATAEVRKQQRDQLTPEEAKLLQETTATAKERGGVGEKMTAKEALQFAKDHIFERLSVAQDYELLTEALQYGRGQVNFTELKAELATQHKSGEMVIANGLVSSKESIERETRAIGIVNRGTSSHERLGGEDRQYFPSGNLTGEQNEAVKFVLNSRDLAVCLQGAAGTGKTETLRQLRRELIEGGRSVTANRADADSGIRAAGTWLCRCRDC
jgi:conjugative relaxase-like TrwC/TraI family protein